MVGRHNLHGAAHLLQQIEQVRSVVIGAIGSQLLQLRGGDITHAIGDLLDAGDLEALALLDGLDKGRGLQQGLVGTGIQPGVAPAQQFNMQSPVAPDRHCSDR